MPKLPCRIRHWLWKFLSRQFLIALRRIVHKGSHNGSGLLQVRRYQVIVAFHIGMVCTSIVLNSILKKLEPGNIILRRSVTGAGPTQLAQVCLLYCGACSPEPPR